MTHQRWCGGHNGDKAEMFTAGGKVCDRRTVQKTLPPASSGPLPSGRRPIAVDLFSGAGGLSLGFEQAGFDVVAAVEYDPVHAATHMFNFPHAETLCRDISQLSAVDLISAAERGFRTLHPRKQWLGEVDAIVGGPPCQGFSSGGKRLVDDDRNDLLLHFVRLVAEVRPRVFCLENVAGLLESTFEEVRREALQVVRNAGYRISGTEKPLNSMNFGVPQSRRRVIILGSLDDVAPAIPSGSEEILTVAGAFEGLPSIAQYDGLLHSDEVELHEPARALRLAADGAYARQLSGLAPIPGDKSRPRQWVPEVLTNSRRTVHTPATIARFGETLQGTVEPKSRLFRLSEVGVSRTLRAGTGAERGAHTSPRPIHPTEDRVITVREAARLHGYPDWFRFHTTNWHGHRQVGNSVPPPLARAAAASLLASLQVRPAPLRAAIPLGDVALLSLSRSQALSVVDATDSELPGSRIRVNAPGAAGTGDEDRRVAT